MSRSPKKTSTAKSDQDIAAALDLWLRTPHVNRVPQARPPSPGGKKRDHASKVTKPKGDLAPTSALAEALGKAFGISTKSHEPPKSKQATIRQTQTRRAKVKPKLPAKAAPVAAPKSKKQTKNASSKSPEAMRKALAGEARRANERATLARKRKVRDDARRALNATLASRSVKEPARKLPTYSKLFANITSEPFEILVHIWRCETLALATIRPGRPPSPSDIASREAVSRIEQEWQRRQIEAATDPDYFAWPTTESLGGNGNLPTSGWHEEGYLAVLGYHVGMSSALHPVQRQSLLDRVFKISLPPLNGADYMNSWGAPASAPRLKKIADSLASSVRRAKDRSGGDWSTAIAEWESDLDHMFVKFYKGVFHFHWPRT